MLPLSCHYGKSIHYSLKSKTIQGISDSSDNEFENCELPEIVIINHEIQCLALKVNCLCYKFKVNFKLIIDLLLPNTTVQNMLWMKIEGVSSYWGCSGELCSNLIYQDIEIIHSVYQDFSDMNMLESIKSCNKNLLSFVLGGSGLHLNKLPEKGQYALVFPYVIQILY